MQESHENKRNTCASSNNMVLLHNSFAIPVKYHQQSIAMAQSQYICTQIPYTLQAKCLEHVIGWLWNWPRGGSTGNEQWLLRQWKGKQYRVSQQEGPHGCHEGYLLVSSDVCRDMVLGLDQGDFILRVWSLPFGTAMTSTNPLFAAGKVGCPNTQHSPAWLHCLSPGFLPLMKHKVGKYTQTKKAH